MLVHWCSPAFVDLTPGFFVVKGEMWYLQGSTIIGKLDSENFLTLPQHGKFMCRCASENFGFIEHLAIERFPDKRFVWPIKPGQKLSINNGYYKAIDFDPNPLIPLFAKFLQERNEQFTAHKIRTRNDYRFLYERINEYPRGSIPKNYRAEWEDQAYEMMTKIEYAEYCIDVNDPIPPNATIDRLLKTFVEIMDSHTVARESLHKRARIRDSDHVQGSD